MKVNVKESAKCQKTLHIEVPKEVINGEFERYYEYLKKTAQVPGYRKGKVPREILEQYFSDKASDKVLTTLVSDNYQKAIEQEDIHPVQLPEISDVQFKKDAKLTFQAKVDIRPKFKLKEYKGIKLKKQRMNIKEEEITRVLSFLQERYAQFIPVEDRPTKIGDYIICDYSYSVEGKVIEKKERAWFGIEEKLFIPGLPQALEGIKVQEKKEFDLALPEKFQPAELAKKTANFSITVYEIKNKKLPELNDELAKTIGKDTLVELKTQIKGDLEREKQMQVHQDMKKQLIEYLIKTMAIDVPQTLVVKREQSLKEASRQRLKQQGMTDEQINAEENKAAGHFHKQASQQVMAFFILDEIAHKENIKVEQPELDKRVELIAQSYNQKKEDVLKYLTEKNLLENIHSEIWEEKVISFLVEHAKIEEINSK